MKRVLTIAFLLLAAPTLLAFEMSGTLQQAGSFQQAGTLQQIDTDNHMAVIVANGQGRTLVIDPDVKVLSIEGQPLPGGLKAEQLKPGVDVTVTVQRESVGLVIKAIRVGRFGERAPRPSVGFKPLTEMTAADRYKGEDGGLYGGGKNDPPPVHLKAARAESRKIEPLDPDGRPSRNGTIALISISMSMPRWNSRCLRSFQTRTPKSHPS
jgi:hypothetical protein